MILKSLNTTRVNCRKVLVASHIYLVPTTIANSIWSWNVFCCHPVIGPDEGTNASLPLRYMLRIASLLSSDIAPLLDQTSTFSFEIWS